jgi:hypothetical protein
LSLPNASHAASPVFVFDGPLDVVQGTPGAQLTSCCADAPEAINSDNKKKRFMPSPLNGNRTDDIGQ